MDMRIIMSITFTFVRKIKGKYFLSGTVLIVYSNTATELRNLFEETKE